jgi:hypothetical protein
VARHTAEVLRALCDGEPLPPAPDGLDADLAGRLDRVRGALGGLFTAAGATVGGAPLP